MDFDLRNKIVAVTGASSGLGKAIAEAFAAQGSIVYIAARDSLRLTNIADKLLLDDQTAIPVYLDVTDYRQVENLASKIINEQGRLDVWVNNAGIDQKTSLDEITPELLAEITAVNYFGVVYGTQAAARKMRLQHYGDIIQIISTSAFTPRPNESPYCAAKAAAALFSKCVQPELKPYGIRVIPFYPGGMDTPFFEKAGLQLPPNSMKPEDIAKIVLQAVSLPRNIVLAPEIYRNG